MTDVHKPGFMVQGLGDLFKRLLGNIGIMENKMEITIVYWGYIGIIEKNRVTRL